MQIFVLLDKSGSMQNMLSEAVASINNYVRKIEFPETRVNIAAFDSISYDLVRSTTVKQYRDIKVSEITPMGCTPLFDYVAKTVDLAKEINDPKTLIVIMTDGEENASHMYRTSADIQKKLAEINFPIVYLGAEMKNVEAYASSALGINKASSSYVTRGNLSNFTTNLSAKTSSYFTDGNASAMLYSDEEKAAFKE